jgi:hypothetical protein
MFNFGVQSEAAPPGGWIDSSRADCDTSRHNLSERLHEHSGQLFEFRACHAPPPSKQHSEQLKSKCYRPCHITCYSQERSSSLSRSYARNSLTCTLFKTGAGHRSGFAAAAVGTHVIQKKAQAVRSQSWYRRTAEPTSDSWQSGIGILPSAATSRN